MLFTSCKIGEINQNQLTITIVNRSLPARTSPTFSPPKIPMVFPSSFNARPATRQGDLLRADETRTKRLQSVDSESEGEFRGAGAAERPSPMAEFQRLCRAPHVVPWVRIFGVRLKKRWLGKWALKFYPGFFFRKGFHFTLKNLGMIINISERHLFSAM